MSPDCEVVLSIFLAVIGFVTAVLAGINQLLRLRDNLRPHEEHDLEELEDDVERLDAQVQAHSVELEQLKRRR